MAGRSGSDQGMKRIALLVLLMLLAFTGTASAWLSGYDYRMQIDINNTGDNQTYYQYSFTMDTAIEIAAGNMSYTDGRDCRVTDSSDNLIPFWNETAFNKSDTKIWVNGTALVNTSNTTHYIYYEKSDVSSVANISTTMLFGDDFESGNLNQWDQPAGGTITSTAGEVYAGIYAVKTNQAINNFYENLSFGSTLIIEGNVKPIAAQGTWFGTIVGNTYDSNSRIIGNYTGGNYNIYDGAFHDSGVTFTGYQKLKLVINSTHVAYYGDTSTLLYTTTSSTSPDKLILYNHASEWGCLDNVFVRKYTETEPTASLGAVEENPTATITSWSNNETNNNSLSFNVANETTVLFNITADQTITNWYWTNATGVQGNGTADSNASHYFNAEGATTVGVYGTNANGSTATKTWTVTVPDTTPPAQVTGLQNDTYKTSQINISWTANTEGDLWGYEVFRDNISVGYTQNIYHNDSGMRWGHQYNYKVRANDTSDNWGTHSSILSTTTKGTFTDDFESYPIGSFNNTGQSNWIVVMQSWGIISNNTQKLTPSTSSEGRIYLSDFDNRNFNASIDVTFNSSAAYAGMFIRWDGSRSTGYSIIVSRAFSTIKLYTQMSSSVYATLESETYSFNPGQEYNLKIKMDDALLIVYIDDVEELNYTDYYRVDTIMSEGGYVGLYHSGGSTFFDNFSVEMLTENDEYLNYFDYTVAGANSITLRWALAGYDNATIRRGTNIEAITTEIYHGTATTYTDSSLSTDTTYYYNITYNNGTKGHIVKVFTYDLPTTRKYVAFGDSISTDYGTLLVNESFPYLLNETIAANNDSAITHSISAIMGYTTNGIIFGQLDDILTEKPTFITIMAGWNDFNLDHDEDNYRANFKYIINESTKHGIDVFVLHMINTSTAKVQSYVQDTNDWIDGLGEEYVVMTEDAVDLIPFNDVVDGYNLSNYQDGIHPNYLNGTTNIKTKIYDYMVDEGYFADAKESFVNPTFAAAGAAAILFVAAAGRFAVSAWRNRRRKRRN